MSTSNTLRPRRHLSGAAWLLYGGVYGSIAFLFQFIGLGFIKSPGEYIVIAGSNGVLTLLSWAFLPRAKPYLWGVLPQLLFAGFMACYAAALLLAQEPVGYEPTAPGWEGNLALSVLVAGYLIQLGLLVQALRSQKGTKETEVPVL